MSKMIAVTGKGGVGKTAVTALAVDTLVRAGQKPLLAVDADPNLNLDAALGVHAEQTVGGIRENVVDGDEQETAGMTKPEFLDYRIQMSIVEASGFDLIAMGRPEGPGCYCFANEILRDVLGKLARRYSIVVVDCEAGLEHLSRRTTGDVDLLLAVTDPSVRGMQTCRRAIDLLEEVRTSAADIRVVLNRVRGDIPDALAEAAEDLGLEFSIRLPEDENLRTLDALGRPLTELSDDNPFRGAIEELLADCGLIDPAEIPVSHNG
ncbi:MAG: AAA family ATPase [Armatimonadota bacterium]